MHGNHMNSSIRSVCSVTACFMPHGSPIALLEGDLHAYSRLGDWQGVVEAAGGGTQGAGLQTAEALCNAVEIGT